MCLTIPKKVISIKKNKIIVGARKDTQNVETIIKVKKGDWVLTLNNVIISKISKKEAREIKDLYKRKEEK